MSDSYASRLSHYPNKGIVGLPENFDTQRALSNKLKRLTDLVQKSSYTVILTGAGISTAAKIPDFRGPKGIWTLEKRREQQQQKVNNGKQTNGTKRKRPDAVSSSTSTTTPSCDFSKAQPTLTHHAITALCQQYGKVNFVITQNVDGLHRKSGLSRNFHSPVHGCVFTEKCSHCGTEVFFSSQETGGLSFQPIPGHNCPNCTSQMHDILLDWEDMVLDLEKCNQECEKADLVICLGTSLRINPVGSLPLLAKQFVIVNLQQTPLDEQAALVIRAKVDDVMEHLMIQLGYTKWKNNSAPSIEQIWQPDNNTEFMEILAYKKDQKQGEAEGKHVKLETS